MSKTGIVEVSESTITLPKVYEEIVKDNYQYFFLSSGRVSGKSTALVLMWWVAINKYQDDDIMILQATTIEIKDSLINEIEAFLENSGYDVGTDETHEWVIPKSKEIVYRRGQKIF